MSKQPKKTMIEHDAPRPSIDCGPLRMNSLGRWEISLGRDRINPELSSGTRIFLNIYGDWRLTSVEYSHAANRYVSVDGYALADGIMAALPTA
jgi:hypothetical protein